MFVLSEYKQALCKESYKRLTFYLVQRDEFSDSSDDFCNLPSLETSKPEIPEELVVFCTDSFGRLYMSNTKGAHLSVKHWLLSVYESVSGLPMREITY